MFVETTIRDLESKLSAQVQLHEETVRSHQLKTQAFNNTLATLHREMVRATSSSLLRLSSP